MTSTGSNPENVNVDGEIDYFKYERTQRQLSIELVMKREQVNQLREEQYSANLRIQNLIASLETARKELEDAQLNLGNYKKLYQNLEDKMENMRIALKNRNQQDSLVAEVENGILKEMLKKSEMENYVKEAKLQDLKAQHQCDSVYQKELMLQDAKLRKAVEQCNSVFEKLLQDQNKLLDARKHHQEAVKMQKTIDFMKDHLKKKENQIVDLEDKLLYIETKHKTYTNLNNSLNHVLDLKNNLVVFDELTKSRDAYKEQLETNTNITVHLAKNLNEEKEANLKLLVENKALEKQLKDCIKRDVKETAVQTEQDEK